MVRQSRSVKRAYEGRGTGRGGPPEPKSRTKARSLIRHRPTLAPEEAKNLAEPLVVREAGVLCTVEERVSTLLAVK